MTESEMFSQICDAISIELNVKHGDVFVRTAYIDFPQYQSNADLYQLWITNENDMLFVRLENINTNSCYFNHGDQITAIHGRINYLVNLLKYKLTFMTNLSRRDVNCNKCHI